MNLEEKPQRWIGRMALGIGAFLATFMILTASQPYFPFTFLRGQKLLHASGPNRSLERLVVVEGSFDDIVEAAKNEFGVRGSRMGLSDEVQYHRGSDSVLITRSRDSILRLDPQANEILRGRRSLGREIVAVSYKLDPNVFRGFVNWLKRLIP